MRKIKVVYDETKSEYHIGFTDDYNQAVDELQIQSHLNFLESIIKYIEEGEKPVDINRIYKEISRKIFEINPEREPF